MGIERWVCTPEANVRRHRIGVSVDLFDNVMSSGALVNKPQAVAEFFVGLALQRAAPPTVAGDADAEQDEAAAREEAQAAAIAAMQNARDSMAQQGDGAAAQVQPDMLDSWSHSPAIGVHAYGVEFNMPWNEGWEDPVAARGFRHQVHIVVNLPEDRVWAVHFKAPASVWGAAWSTHGETIMDNVYINWEDMSPMKFA